MNKQDYTTTNENLSSIALSLGGQVKRIVDLDTGEIATDCAEVSCLQDTALGRSALSTAHISPFVEWSEGASLLKVSKGRVNKKVGGGKRGKVSGFSHASRRRLMQTIARVKRDADLPLFVTLTYPMHYPSPVESKKHLDIFLKRIRRRFPDIGLIWKLEPQERGAPHYHMLAWGCDVSSLREFVPFSWYEIAGDNDNNHLKFHLGLLGNSHCVSIVNSFRGVWAYASKYLGKTFKVSGWDEKPTGRFWAVVNRENIPFGREMVMRVTVKNSHVWMRYQKRFAKLKSRDYSSITTFCDAEQWIKNFLTSEVKAEENI